MVFRLNRRIGEMFWTGSSEKITDFTRNKKRNKRILRKRKKHTREQHQRYGWAVLPDGRKIPYEEYLTSREWAAVRKRYRASKLPQVCLGCDDPRVEFHHRTYERLGNERLTDLAPVCSACHKAIHDAHNRGKQDLWRTTKRVLKKIRKKAAREPERE